ncbi:hypothetical protein E3U43_011902 [Larimichthys crocea]|uniref:Uncharacterized protein n=1 Tax=Larimichthys crocea TaxID=215358 RepID=A0ACD3QLU0_LARCR|nr:hypothetical protein E3U43_011902 [Larimichthys crocea]
MNAVRGGTVTWRPQPWQDGDGGGGEPLSDSDSEEEDFPDDSTTPLGDYITHGLKQLLDAQQLCDVTLLVEGKKFMCHREGRGSGVEREVTGGGVMVTAEQRGAAGGGSDRAPSPVVFPGLPRRIAAGGVARWKRRIYVLGGENGSRFYDSVYCWKPGWRSWVQRREKLPGDTGGVSQFGCTTLKFPKKHILSRLRLAKENCKKAAD